MSEPLAVLVGFIAGGAILMFICYTWWALAHGADKIFTKEFLLEWIIFCSCGVIGCILFLIGILPFILLAG